MKYFISQIIKIRFWLGIIVLGLLYTACGYTGSGNLELPAAAEGRSVVSHSGYTFQYNESTEQADWVAYELTLDELNGTVERTNNFKPDPNVSTGTATDEDYYKSGYDRGHLAPAADMTWSEQAMTESFYYSNMSPQYASFNRGIWRQLEGRTRKWAAAFDRLLIVSGPLFLGNSTVIGPNKVSIPSHYFKVLLVFNDSVKEGVAFILPNKKGEADLFSYAVTIDSVEQATGIDFYAALPNREERKIESTLNREFWQKALA